MTLLALGALAGCGSSERTTRYIDYTPTPPNGLSINQANVICSYGPAKQRKQLGDYCDPIVFQNKVGLPVGLAQALGANELSKADRFDCSEVSEIGDRHNSSLVCRVFIDGATVLFTRRDDGSWSRNGDL